MEQTRATINALVEPICILHAESLASLAADAHQLRLSQEEDRAAVQNEVHISLSPSRSCSFIADTCASGKQNEHLKATIQQLRADHKRQRQAAEDADADTLAVLTAAFKARAASSEQNRSSTLENLSNTLQSRSEDRVAQTTKRLDRSAMMTRSNLKSGETYERINTLVNDIVATRGEVRPALFHRLVLMLTTLGNSLSDLRSLRYIRMCSHYSSLPLPRLMRCQKMFRPQRASLRLAGLHVRALVFLCDRTRG